MEKLILLYLSVSCFFMADLFSQNASISIGNIYSCTNTLVEVPVNVENLTSIGAMTLYIAFDTTVLHFDTIRNIHPQFAGLIFNMMYLAQPYLAINYSNIGGANLTSGKLMDIVFTYKNGMTALDFLPSCELYTTNLVWVPVLYNNGSVQQDLITITQQPVDVTVHQPEPAIFQVVAQPATATFKWQQSLDNGLNFVDLVNGFGITGVNTSQLKFAVTSPSMNNRFYRCKISIDGCSLFSASAKLTVLAPYVSQSVTLQKGWNSFSTFIQPLNLNPEAVFAGIEANLIIVASDAGVYYPPGNMNTMGNFDPASGYIIKLQNEATLVLTGNRQTNQVISFSTGYNLTPVISECPVSITILFGKNLPQVEFIRDKLGVICYWPAMGIYDLQMLQPGRAYLVKTTSDIQVTFPSCD